MKNATIKSKLSNSNGSNQVNVIFYRAGTEVAKMSNCTLNSYSDTIVTSSFPNSIGIDRTEIPLRIRILNASKDAKINAYYTNSSGVKVATLVSEVSSERTYNDTSKLLTSTLKLTKTNAFSNDEYSKYNIHIIVDNVDLSYTNSYECSVYASASPNIYLVYTTHKAPFYYHVEGINLLTLSPFTR